MFTQQKLFFRFTKAIALVILVCFTFSCQAHGKIGVKEKANNVIEERVTEFAVSPVVDMDMAKITDQIDIEHYEKEFEKYIKKSFEELKKAFKESKFNKMADLLGNNTIIATPQGERLKGKDSLGRFWRKEKERGITDVSFTLKYQFVSIVADPIEQPDPQDTIDAIGHAIIEYCLITRKKGETLKNNCGSGDMCAGHPQRCEWGE